jgi:mannosyltransferase
MTRVLRLGLLVALLVGAGMRVTNLGAESLWLDEACSIEAAHKSLAGIVRYTTEDVHPPLYYWVLHYWIRIAGHSEWAARLFSVLFSTLTIFLVYRLAARFFGPPTGVVAAMLLAISPMQLAAAQEARMYALLTFLSAWSMTAFARLLDEPRRSAFAGYVIATAFMLYTHAYGAFVLGAQLLFLAGFVLRRGRTAAPAGKRVLLAQSLAFLLFLPWLPILFFQVFRVQRAFWIPAAPPAEIGTTFLAYAGGPLLAGLLIPLAAIALVFERANRWTGLLAVWLACLVALPFALSVVSVPIFLAKYAIAGSLAFTVLAARGLTLVPRPAWRLVIGVAVAALAIVPVREHYRTRTKDDWRQATPRLEALARSGDLVLFDQPYGRVAFDYYAKRGDLDEQPFLTWREGLTTRTIVEALRVAAQGSDRVWLVLSSWDPVAPLLVEELQATYDVAVHLRDRGIESYLFVARAAAR